MPHDLIQYDRPKHGAPLRISIVQLPLNGYDLSYNPDDERWYVTHNEETVATFTGDRKGFHNARYYMRTH